QRGLPVAAEDTVRVYAEVYGLRVSAERVSYHVTYRILRSDDLQRDIAREDWPGAIGLEFDRASGGAEGRSVTEMLDLSPQQIPRGSYLLRVQVWDNAAAAQIGRAMVAARVREMVSPAQALACGLGDRRRQPLQRSLLPYHIQQLVHRLRHRPTRERDADRLEDLPGSDSLF